MERPDPYGDWVLLPTGEEKSESIAPDDELLSAARAAWPHALAEAKRQFTAARLDSDGAAFAVQVWEQLLRSVSKTRQRNRDQRPPIANLEGYLIGAFRHRLTRVLVREQKRVRIIELVSSSFDLERIESAKNTEWVEELERAITLKEIAEQMDPLTRKIWQGRQYGYSWKEIADWLGTPEDGARKKFEYGIEKTRQNIVRLLHEKRHKRTD
jgi:DNA-directed RNA polymerase specialized sigma24 family protein